MTSADWADIVAFVAAWLGLLVLVVWPERHRCKNRYCPHNKRKEDQ